MGNAGGSRLTGIILITAGIAGVGVAGCSSGIPPHLMCVPSGPFDSGFQDCMRENAEWRAQKDRDREYARSKRENEEAREKRARAMTDRWLVAATLVTLRAALVAGQKEEARQQLAFIADVNLVGERSYTALHVVAAYGDTEMVESVLSRGAHVDAMDFFRGTPLFYATLAGNRPVADLLIAKGAKVDAEIPGGADLKEAVLRGNALLAAILIAAGADVHQRDGLGRSLLHHAVASQSSGIRIAALLIASGVDVNAQTNFGHTALFLAISMGDHSMADLLRQHGAKEPPASSEPAQQ